MSNADILQLAAEALADAAQATPGPWKRDGRTVWTQEWILDENGRYLSGTNHSIATFVWPANEAPPPGTEATLDWIAAARSREPQLAEACIAMAKEVERLRTTHDIKIESEATMLRQCEQLEQQLAAMTAARDEACDLGSEIAHNALRSGSEERAEAIEAFASYRQVGGAK